MKRLFLRWSLLASLIAIGTLIALFAGGFKAIAALDSSNISFVILAIFYATTAWCGYLCWKTSGLIESRHLPSFANTFKERLEKIANQAEHGWFARLLCAEIGMLGTILGFVLMLADFKNLQAGGGQAFAQQLGKLALNMGIALITTLVGSVSAILLGLQYHLLCNTIDKEKK